MNFLLASLLALNIPQIATDSPNRQPQLAAANGTVALVFGSGHSILLAQSHDNGASFSSPVTVAEPGALALGRHRGPRVVISRKALLVSAAAGDTAASDLLLWRSMDAGKSWSKAIRVNDVPTSAREGLHAMAADGNGHVAAVWLDLRDGTMRLYGAYSADEGATWSKNFLVYHAPDGPICQCCHPSLVATANGAFAAMFRNCLDGNRDLYLIHLRNGRVASAAEKLGTGSWKLNACPMDGGALAFSVGRIITAWRRGTDLFLAEPGKPETRIGDGADIALTVSGGKTYAVWTRGGALEAMIDGKVETLAPAGAYPSVTALPWGGALAAWESSGIIQIIHLLDNQH